MFSHLCGFTLNNILDLSIDGSEGYPKCYKTWDVDYISLISLSGTVSRISGHIAKAPKMLWSWRSALDGTSFVGKSDYKWDTGYTNFVKVSKPVRMR